MLDAFQRLQRASFGLHSPASGPNDDRVTCRFQEVEGSEETFTWQPPRTELGISKFGKKFEAWFPKNWVCKEQGLM